MKPIKWNHFLAILLASTAAAHAAQPAAESSAPTPPPAATTETVEPERVSGVIRELDATERTLRLKSFWNSRTYHIGETCKVSLERKPAGTLADLLAGHHVEIVFQKHDGVRVVTEMVQRDETLTGFVTTLDPTNRVFRVDGGWTAKEFTASENCQLILRDQSKRPFGELEVGQRVTVTYLTPADGNVAQAIAHRSLEFEGRVESLDARRESIQAAGMLSHRTFQMGNDCQIVIGGQLGGELKDLRIGDRVTFHYEDVDGVLVANRIELETAPEEPEAQRLTSRGSPER